MLKEGPQRIEIETCAGCKYYRLGFESNKIIGICCHPALEHGPQHIGIQNIPLPFITPKWCKVKKIEENKV